MIEFRTDNALVAGLCSVVDGSDEWFSLWIQAELIQIAAVACRAAVDCEDFD